MTSDATNTSSSPPDPQASAIHGGASQLWVRAGSWHVRADHIVAVGVRDDHQYREDKRKHTVRVATAAMRGSDGDIEPATYLVARFADKDDARRCASSVVERLGTWTAGYGVLYVSDQGGVATSRPNPRRADTAVDPSEPADPDRPDSATA
jgi:hypothetical protein